MWDITCAEKKSVWGLREPLARRKEELDCDLKGRSPYFPVGVSLKMTSCPLCGGSEVTVVAQKMVRR